MGRSAEYHQAVVAMDYLENYVMNDPDDRFGMPPSAFEAAKRNHGINSSVFRSGMYVPTRHEVATWPADRLSSIVIDWMWESPSDLIPDNDQIVQLREILLARDDADDQEMKKLIAECDDFLKA